MEKAATSKLPEGNNTEDEDPVELMLKRTGCLEKHYSVLECISETKDWRLCQQVVAEFRQCMDAYKQKKNKV
ncbi:unnamed protein product [Allacma fusca]|uniref:Cytochrome c oxidase assembly factor 4 homolog, mitochondrial n=1 Tax=Allacma fusca TaxID=39272 RepID=A0A8J2JV77_9HEXA|nr:unnamed protein product [Allacma fusca]